jgi:nucleotide-binding universal stress UspA family protein
MRVSVLEGRPAAAINRYAREHAIDLIVMTRHGRGGSAIEWLGSTADAVLRLAGVPVLLVHGTAGADGFRKVVAALDGSTTAERALDAECDVAPEADRLLLHVVGPLHAEAAGDVTDVLERECAGHRYLDAVARRIGAANGSTETRVVVSPDVAGTILRDAAAASADLIVLGTHARPPIVRAILGGVADKVIRRGHVSVLVAPPKRDRLEPIAAEVES